jgi:Xaa-Pro aminopeptidase
VEQPETILVLVPGSRTRKEILFIRPSNPQLEHWVGHFLTADEARAQTGIETVLLTTQFDDFVLSMFNRRPFGLPPGAARDDTDHEEFFRALDEGAGRLALRLESPPRFDAPLSAEYAFASQARERLIGVSIVNLAPAVHALRQVKTRYEQKLLQQRVEISAEAHVAGMKAARPERYEYEVEAGD